MIDWQSVPGLNKYKVAFSYPCPLRYGWSYARGCKDNCTRNDHAVHGHVHLQIDGVAYRVPFNCFSRSGVKAVLQLLVQSGVLPGAAVKSISNLEVVKALPRTATPFEQRILRSPRLRQRDTVLLAG